MPYEITVPDGKKYRTDHFDIDTVVEIAKECETSWAHVVEMPIIGDGSVMLAVFTKCCKKAGVDVPRPLSATKLSAAFVEVDEDTPYDFEGGVPVPTEGDAPDKTPADSPVTT